MDLENDGNQRSWEEFVETGRAFSERGGPGLTQEQKNTVVEYHNKLRKQEGASNMEVLVCKLTPCLKKPELYASFIGITLPKTSRLWIILGREYQEVYTY